MTDQTTGKPSSHTAKRSQAESFRQSALGTGRRDISRWITLLGITTMAASAATFLPGYLTYEYYPATNRVDVETGVAGSPSTAGATVGADKSGYTTSFEAASNIADNYANRLFGYFVPPVTGDYVFFVAGDDDSDLFLSTDSTAANKKLIAQEAGWSPVRSYTVPGSGSTSIAEDKRSDSFSGTEWPDPTIHLTGGQKYYIEAVHHDGTGGDNFAVTYKLAADPDPAVGAAPLLLGSVIGTDVATAPADPSISITTQPLGGTFYVGGTMSLNVAVQSDSPYPVAYQWRKNGTNIVGATSAKYTVATPTAADNGTYDVIVSVPGSTGAPKTVTSTAAAVNVAQSPLVTGKLKYEYFPGTDRPTVESGAAGDPSFAGATVGADKSGYITNFQAGEGFADNYANRVSGFFIPPTTADYVFYVAGDDDSDLFLSTDDNPANKKLIAQEVGYSGSKAWNTPGGGNSVATDKRSDSFAATQWPDSTIHLISGQKYYIEGVHHDGTGGDDFGVTYRLATEDEALTADGTASRLSGNVIGVLVPQIITFAGLNAGQKALSFSINDVGPSVLDPASVKLTLDNQAVTPTSSPKDTNGVSSFSFTYPAPFAQGSTHSYSIVAKDSSGQIINSSADFTIPTQFFPTNNLPGPATFGTKWVSRFILGAGNIVDVPSSLRAIAASTSNDFAGSVIDVVTNVINWQGTDANAGSGLFGTNNTYPDEVINDPNWTGDNFVNLNIGHLNIAEEGDYTFGVHSDDGFALRIRGAQVVSISGAGQIDPVDPEVVLENAPTGDSNTRAVYHLKKGVYLVELLIFEDTGGDSGEFYAAKGAFANDGDTTTWRLVGDTTPSQQLTLLGVDTNGWTVISSDPGGDVLDSWAVADADLAATGGGAKNYDVLNVGDPDTNPGVAAFPKDTPGGVDDNYFTLKATATLVVPQDGTYVIGFNSDDGGYMKIAGQTFLEIQQNNTGLSVIDGDTVTCDCLTGDSGTTATITLTKGNYQIEIGSFEDTGGAFLAAHGALAPALPITTADMPFLAKGAAGTTSHTPSALLLTSAAADGGGGSGGTGPQASISISGSSITISSSSGGTVQATTTLTSPDWQDLGAAPQTVSNSGNARFFRIKQ